MEFLNNGQSGVLYREVTFIQRSFNTQSTMVGQQQVSFTERCALFGVSIIRRLIPLLLFTHGLSV